MSARAEILDRVRRAIAVQPVTVAVPRDYRAGGDQPWDRDRLVGVLVDRLLDYKAGVVRCDEDGVANSVTGVLARHAVLSVVVPAAFPGAWLPGDVELRRDQPALSAYQLDAIDAVLTTSAVAVAETGTIVLDTGPGMGRRALTLVPDLHVVVVRVRDIVRGVPEALARLEAGRPQTWISGPSATSDIELDRVEGVHGPRRLEVVLVGQGAS